jgi:hypothetical protein
MDLPESEVDGSHHEKAGACMSRLLGPVINFVDRPYKVNMACLLSRTELTTCLRCMLLAYCLVSLLTSNAISHY